ncbi:MAG TPA: hypothetical protein VGL75_10965 [Acidothermaceae bacterium]
MSNPWLSVEPPCPEWCRNGAEHLANMIRQRGGGQYFHRGEATVIVTDDVTHNFDPVEVEIHLMQRVEMDARGVFMHPPTVEIGEHSFDLDRAREVAARIVALADRAQLAARE